MEIRNAKITHASVALDDRDRLSAQLCFDMQSKHSTCRIGLVITDPNDARKLQELMIYTDTYEFDKLCGKIVRVVIHKGTLHGFVHPTEDRFISVVDNGFLELTEKQFKQAK